MLDKISELDGPDTLIVGLFVAVIVGVIAWILVRVVKADKEYLCKSCGSVGKPAKVTPGSFILEIGLWIAFIVPGILYSIYRVTKRHNACANCKSKNIIPKDSPIAGRFIKENGLVSDQV